MHNHVTTDFKKLHFYHILLPKYLSKQHFFGDLQEKKIVFNFCFNIVKTVSGAGLLKDLLHCKTQSFKQLNLKALKLYFFKPSFHPPHLKISVSPGLTMTCCMFKLHEACVDACAYCICACAGVIGACERRLCNVAVGDDDREAQM